MSFKNQTLIFLATGAWVGKIPFAPGTFGTVLGLPICWLLSGLNDFYAAVITVVFIFAAIVIAHRAEILLGAKDPGCIVIDEIAGMFVALLGLPFNTFTALAGFAIFRSLDIAKPFPIRQLDQRIKGGVGIVLDDVAAGIATNLILRMLLTLIK
jgi:phosphatidylglycerophosphatase A